MKVSPFSSSSLTRGNYTDVDISSGPGADTKLLNVGLLSQIIGGEAFFFNYLFFLKKKACSN